MVKVKMLKLAFASELENATYKGADTTLGRTKEDLTLQADIVGPQKLFAQGETYDVSEATAEAFFAMGVAERVTMVEKAVQALAGAKK